LKAKRAKQNKHHTRRTWF